MLGESSPVQKVPRRPLTGPRNVGVRNAEKGDLRDHPAEDDDVAAVDLSDPCNPAAVGDWQDNDQVNLKGLSLNARGDREYVGGVGPGSGVTKGVYGRTTEVVVLYVLDLQDPCEPVGTGDYPYPSAEV